ncbi:MAG TPA: saccharopine dehydrogenase NADP-binding domain-containing protein [Polyangiales bacterium]|nr:saccharopine dehydrogenase NADP-binding domain-containing protein [Polyangiales bacterium]
MSERAFDIVLFGATGFTGEQVAHYLADARCERLRWALAGRNREKLERLKAQLVGRHASPAVMVAEAGDSESMHALVSTTRVVITTVGPYLEHGEALVAACAEYGTDYADLSCEPEFLRRSSERYHALAEISQARIIHACGFDSMSHDLGAYFAVTALRRRLTLGEQDTLPVVVRGVGVSGGSFRSLVGLLGRLRRSAARGLPLMAAGRRISALRQRFEYRKPLGMWVMPLPSVDSLIVGRSARALDVYGPSFQYGHYLGLRHLLHVVRAAAGLGAAFGLSRWQRTRSWLIERNPATRGWFRVLFEAQAGAHSLRAVVRAGDADELESAKMLAETGLCLAFDRVLLPRRFGVLTAAVAMGDVLVARLQRAGIVFEVLASA